jgi:2-polyprenyl-6-methoxyphenol hydroxylase-like FAD-dependent oxidoreductase
MPASVTDDRQSEADVLIVGAGPSGLVLALWLVTMGVRVRLIDTAAEAGTTSRALAVQARTLELYRQQHLVGDVLARGHRTAGVNLWVRGERKARVPLTDIGRGMTPFPFLLIYPQDEHERLLIDALATLGVTVERGCELTGLHLGQEKVTALLRHDEAAEETASFAYVAGCDGAHSRVREALGVEFPGGMYQQRFYVADVAAHGPCVDGELHIDLDEADFLAVFPLADEGRARVIGAVRGERAERDDLTFADVSDRAIGNLKLVVDKVNWFSTYRVHHRVAHRFRRGRAFLVGDAAHIHSPAGGQGMNTGIGDAINLAWKLAAVLNGGAAESLLDSYEAERIAFARRLVATTDRVFSFATGEGRAADLLRTRLAPVVAPLLLAIAAVRRFVFRTVSQITLNYRDGPLSVGAAGGVRAGDRLPWVPAGPGGGGDNFAPLDHIGWQVHVYGQARPELADWCAARQLPLHVFGWLDAHQSTGLERDGLYLLRPDTYVGLACRRQSPAELDGYFARIGVRPDAA